MTTPADATTIRVLAVGNRRDFLRLCQVQQVSPHSGQITHVPDGQRLRGCSRDRTLVVLLPSWQDLRDWRLIHDVIQATGLTTKELDPWKEVLR